MPHISLRRSPGSRPGDHIAAYRCRGTPKLTVIFCDLVGSTALSAGLDPEDLRSAIGAYHKCVAETVAGVDGFLAKYRGDGLLIIRLSRDPRG
jgi:class 3 adenylate cyclase